MVAPRGVASWSTLRRTKLRKPLRSSTTRSSKADSSLSARTESLRVAAFPSLPSALRLLVVVPAAVAVLALAVVAARVVSSMLETYVDVALCT